LSSYKKVVHYSIIVMAEKKVNQINIGRTLIPLIFASLNFRFPKCVKVGLFTDPFIFVKIKGVQN